MLLRKQTAYHQTFAAKMIFTPSKLAYEAGLVLWWSQYAYATIGITLVELYGGERVQTVVTRGPTGQAGVFNVSRRLKPSAALYVAFQHSSCFADQISFVVESSGPVRSGDTAPHP